MSRKPKPLIEPEVLLVVAIVIAMVAAVHFVTKSALTTILEKMDHQQAF